MTLVWAYKKITELNGELGFVKVDDDAVAATLIADDKVDASPIGALNLRPLDYSPIAVTTNPAPPPPANEEEEEECEPKKRRGKGKK